MAMFSSASCTLGFYFWRSGCPDACQDHQNPFGGNALSPTQGRRLAVGDRQKVSWLDVSLLSRSSTSRGCFARDRLVQVSRTAIPHCKQIG